MYLRWIDPAKGGSEENPRHLHVTPREGSGSDGGCYLTLITMHETLHAPYLFREWLPFLRSIAIQPVIKEGLRKPEH